MKRTTKLAEKLDRIVSIYEQASRAAAEPASQVRLGPPATRAELDRVEDAIGHRLSVEVRDLYEWHDGCLVWIAPSLGFPNLDHAQATYALMRDADLLPAPSNQRRVIRSSELFPILNIDKVYFCASVIERTREAESSIYLVDVEADRLTHVATSLNGFVDYLLQALDRGRNLMKREYLVDWARDPLRFDPHVVPIGGEGTA